MLTQTLSLKEKVIRQSFSTKNQINTNRSIERASDDIVPNERPQSRNINKFLEFAPSNKIDCA
jgi:hypothetical protein